MKTAFLDFWQHIPYKMDPVIFQIGSFKLQYYGLMYIVGFLTCYGLVRYRLKHESRFNVTTEQVEALSLYLMFGLLIGARLGYVIFYNFSYYLKHPLEVILPFNISNGFQFTGITGMSYHGGLIGIITGALIYIGKNKLDFWMISDLIVPVTPFGYTFGRLGNFINGELYGRVTTMPLGMYFPRSPGVLRHPSQLYEAFFEGLFLFAVLWSTRKMKYVKGAAIAFYLIGYGLVRFVIEFFREPDAHIGFDIYAFSRGQILCSIMIISGILLYFYLNRKNECYQK